MAKNKKSVNSRFVNDVLVLINELKVDVPKDMDPFEMIQWSNAQSVQDNSPKELMRLEKVGSAIDQLIEHQSTISQTIKASV